MLICPLPCNCSLQCKSAISTAAGGGLAVERCGVETQGCTEKRRGELFVWDSSTRACSSLRHWAPTAELSWIRPTGEHGKYHGIIKKALWIDQKTDLFFKSLETVINYHYYPHPPGGTAAVHQHASQAFFSLCFTHLIFPVKSAALHNISQHKSKDLQDDSCQILTGHLTLPGAAADREN